MADLVFLCPQQRDRDAVTRIARGGAEVAFVGADLDTDADIDVDALVRACKPHRPRGVVGTKDRSALLAALVRVELGLPGPTPAALLNCQDKLRSRELQQRVVPEATPRFADLDGNVTLAYPYFVKPVVGRLSESAQIVSGAEDLNRLVHGRPYARAYEAIAAFAGVAPGDCSGFIAEEILAGAEATLEGFVYRGVVTVVGITDSVNYPGTSSFERFEYPTALGDSRRAELADVAHRLMPALGFDGGFFNIEFFVPEGGNAKIIEVNGRIASQFAPLIEFTHGRSSYDALISLALDEDPNWVPTEPSAFALSYCLRVFGDALVERVPSVDADVELLVSPGRLLSQQGTNDAGSYRLCIFTQVDSGRAVAVAAARERAAGLLREFQLSPPL